MSDAGSYLINLFIVLHLIRISSHKLKPSKSHFEPFQEFDTIQLGFTSVRCGEEINKPCIRYFNESIIMPNIKHHF